MRKFLLFLFLFLLLGGALLFWQTGSDNLPRLQVKEIEIEKPALIKELEERISTPPPLIVEVRLPESFLTQAGVVQWTNIQRVNNGLPPLKESAQLSASALSKARNMLEKQYFAHISPSGQGVGDLVREAGYEFIAVGENLALGDFENDEKLVQAWMASPGHRQNILSSQYQEIGVAVLKGNFQGRETWLAVQHFGKPLSSCPQPSQGLVDEISENQSKIAQMYSRLSAFQEEIKQMSQKRNPQYNRKINEYNALVLEYNSLIEKTKLLIEQYNSQVNLFNQCVKK